MWRGGHFSSSHPHIHLCSPALFTLVSVWLPPLSPFPSLFFPPAFFFLPISIRMSLSHGCLPSLEWPLLPLALFVFPRAFVSGMQCAYICLFVIHASSCESNSQPSLYSSDVLRFALLSKIPCLFLVSLKSRHDYVKPLLRVLLGLPQSRD